MKRNKKRLASILLTMIMAMALFFAAPMSVFGASPNWTIDPSGGGDYVSLDALLADVASNNIALSSGDTITLLGSITGSTPLEIDGINVTLKLNGFNLTINTSDSSAVVVSGGSLTVEGPGKMIAKNVGNTPDVITAGVYLDYGLLDVKNGAELTIESTANCGIYNEGGTILLGAGSAINTTGAHDGILVYNGGTATVSNATTSDMTTGDSHSFSGASANGGTITVTGNVVAEGGHFNNGVSAYNGGIINVIGNVTVKGLYNTGAYAQGTDSNITVGGNITTNQADSTGVYALEFSKITAKGDVIVKGAGGIGAEVRLGGIVKIDGKMNIPSDGKYILFGSAEGAGTEWTKEMFEDVTSLPLYFTYTGVVPGSAPASYNIVWINGKQDVDHFGKWFGKGIASGKIHFDRYKTLSKLSLGGVVVHAGNYTVTEGSTVITLSEYHLSTLPNQDHTYTAEFPSGAWAELNLTVDNPDPSVVNNGTSVAGRNVPQTDDINSTLGWTVVLVLVFLGIFGLVMWRRKQRA